MSHPRLLLAGGHLDPNLNSLAAAASARGIPVDDARTSARESPLFRWTLDRAGCDLQGEALQSRAAFFRHDVFDSLQDARPEVAHRAFSWTQAVHGWLLVHDEVRIFNRHIIPAAGNKPATLVLAKKCGLRIPQTWITNDLAPGDLTPGAQIAKPVGGGDFCVEYSEAAEKAGVIGRAAAAPAIVQRRLAGPEIRIYIIGGKEFAFELRSQSLDYRKLQDAEIIAVEPPLREVAALRRLMTVLQMDFGAADFKTDPDDGALVFLELNTAPMFARFDQITQGAISVAILGQLGLIDDRPRTEGGRGG